MSPAPGVSHQVLYPQKPRLDNGSWEERGLTSTSSHFLPYALLKRLLIFECLESSHPRSTRSTSQVSYGPRP